MDALSYLLSLEQLGIKLGLDNIRNICAELGDPQLAYRTIIVAGTNGKGSVTAMVDTALRSAGYRSARYTSPHLIRLEERFVIDGAPVSSGAMAAVAEDVRAVVEKLRTSGVLLTHPTFFEASTAIAFELFRRASVDVAVLEVGLGGQFDATNVAVPIAAAITSIDLDHERYLGATIAEIAREKAGVIKPGMTVVIGAMAPEAEAVIVETCDRTGATLVKGTDTSEVRITPYDGRLGIELTTPWARYGPAVLALRGRHQADNALIAVRLLEELRKDGLAVPAQAILTSLTTVRWPGRLDLVDCEGGRQMLLDAAHNPAGAAALSRYLAEMYPAGLPLVFAVMRDKNVIGMLRHLLPHVTSLIATQPRTARAMPAEEIATAARTIAPNIPVEARPDVHRALEAAWARGTTVCVAGSIFLVGEVLEIIPASDVVSRLHDGVTDILRAGGSSRPSRG